MKRITISAGYGLAALAMVAVYVAQAAPQFHHSPPNGSIDVSTYPPAIQQDYRVFVNKCSECHDLSSSLTQPRSAAGWAAEVRRMQVMASSHINDREAGEITEFLTYNESHGNAVGQGASGSGGAAEVSGKELFAKDSCSACHSVGGEGNASFPLDGIGSRRTAAELKQLIVSPPSGSIMPPTTVSDDEINKLVGYLVSLKNR